MPEATPGAVTEREIRSQPATWKQTLQIASPPAAAADGANLLVTGCGSTFYVARWLARHVEHDLRVPVRSLPASELLLDRASWTSAPEQTPLLAISRSGATSETVRVLQDWPGQRLSVTCDARSDLAAQAATRVDLDHAAEESVVQTRSFTSMMLGALSLFRPVPDGVSEAIEEAGARMLADADRLVEDVLASGRPERIVVLGSGPRYGLACEAALKLTEVALVEAQAFHTLEVRHGPMSMIGAGTLVIGLLDGDEPLERKVLADMADLGARTVTVATRHDVAGADLAASSALPDGWRDVLALPFVQLLGLAMARDEQLDPDRPENLTAVVTLDA
ncbi:SIS domain-containing protein [Egicoccus sp. AB-alg2]|uniref:SIS domain-containing protein n=1 Tax=Egicoccus sp. AB-alg2 TaxID=3242693 RepID=UPI00359E3023